MQHLLPVFFCVFWLAAPATSLSGRTWTNRDGKRIEADYISHDAAQVVLRMNGREIPYAIARLSDEDREFLNQLQPSSSASSTPTGYREGLPITQRLFPNVDDYYRQRERRNFRKAFEAGEVKHSEEINLQGTFDDWIKRDPELDTYKIYVPPSYDGSKSYGLLLYIHPNTSHHLPNEWFPLFDAFKLIAAAADNVDNHRAMPRRLQTSMDALVTVEQHYKIDPTRRVVSGLSGGGHMAMLTAACYPDYFMGAISQAAQSYLAYPGGNGYGHFPGFSLENFSASSRRHLKWLVVSGDKDYNYKEILESSTRWKENKLNYRFLDVPGMAHEHAKPEAFRESLQWIGLSESP